MANTVRGSHRLHAIARAATTAPPLRVGYIQPPRAQARSDLGLGLGLGLGLELKINISVQASSLAKTKVTDLMKKGFAFAKRFINEKGSDWPPAACAGQGLGDHGERARGRQGLAGPSAIGNGY